MHLKLPPLLISFWVLQIKSVQELSGQICHICEDGIEITDDGEIFVACNECAFPVCRACYQYERKEGNQACPQCKTRYKRIKGKSLCAFFLNAFTSISPVNSNLSLTSDTTCRYS